MLNAVSKEAMMCINGGIYYCPTIWYKRDSSGRQYAVYGATMMSSTGPKVSRIVHMNGRTIYYYA